ncbi:MAG TPA: trypsin-like peptidase domain-containing protein [Streptosporangiaceae bacterium]|nr:trypsin-like peptidase domain-containing protein [Streptosporangiaceae bacterium]
MDTEHGSSAPYGSYGSGEYGPYGSAPPQPGQQYPAGPPHASGQQGPPPPPPPPPWAGWAGAGWHGYPPVPGARPEAAFGGRGRHGRRPRRRKGLALAAAGTALAVAAGGAAAWATSGSGDSSLSTAAIVSRTDPGLVDVIATLGYQRGEQEGTGMVLTSTGEVLTNNHVIAGATSIKVRDIGNGRTYTASVVGYSDTDDVAVLQLEGASGLTTVSIGSDSSLAQGQKIVAIGNAGGKDGTPSVATGTITGLGTAIEAEDQGDGVVEHLEDMIRTDADIQPGDSGGPLVNSAGQVVGMDTAASSSNSGQPGTTAEVTTTAFAIPISRAISIAEQIEAGQASSTVHIGATAFLGVAVDSQSSGFGGDQEQGVTIEGAIQGTPAAGAGLAEGDTIVSVGGHDVTSSSDLQTVIEGYHPGDKVTVSWTNQLGQAQSATVTLMNGPAA